MKKEIQTLPYHAPVAVSAEAVTAHDTFGRASVGWLIFLPQGIYDKSLPGRERNDRVVVTSFPAGAV